MGYGDELIASGLARGAAARGKRIAFGDGKRIIWSAQSHQIFRGNPNIAPVGSEGAADLEWIAHYRGNRLYGSIAGDRWVFRPFECPAGEVFLSQDERGYAAAQSIGDNLPVVVIEPRVKPFGACAGINKQWALSRYQQVADRLRSMGLLPVQLVPQGLPPLLTGTGIVVTPSFRHALAVLERAALYIGPEGGLHHGAAAMGIPAVVIFGGFNSPASTGYPWHENLAAVGQPCGRVAACRHCQEAMASISVEDVLEAAARASLADQQHHRDAERGHER